MKHYVLIGFCIVLALSCKKDPPVGPPPTTITLTAEDASCIEAWLKVTATEVPATVRLLRDGQPVSVLGLLSPDTLLIDEGLLPKRTYTYQLHKLAADSSEIETSASVQVTTMDTTSHNFTWQIDTLGDGSSSVLYDVAIISDTNTWAVGELFLRDSSGALDPRRYNLARWDGTTWTIERLMYQGSPPVLRSIFAFAENDVWLDPWFHWNGQSFQQVPIDPIFIGVGVNKMWGSPDGKLYVVGNGGFIAERSPVGTWRQLESGTTLPMQDVYGSVESHSGKVEVLAVASDPWHSYSRRIVAIEGQTVSVVSDSGIPTPLSGVWFVAKRAYYTVGSGIFHKQNLTRGRWFGAPNQLTPYYSYAVRGSDLNDIMIVGAYHDVLHFNGWTWRSYPEFLSPGQRWYSVSMKGSRVVAVGFVGNRAAVLRGVRQ